MEELSLSKRKSQENNKKLRLQGKPYSTSKGIRKPGKQLPPDEATCKCKYKCRQLTKEAKEMLFIELYRLSEKQQGTYLMNRVEIVPVSRRRHGKYEDPTESKRQSTMIYTVPTGTGLIQTGMCQDLQIHIRINKQ
ncbi:uncharacterized protein LOC120352987 [Nilaparvata lugens]|uniref:uncharacterized protein LOC120352987 n=1 Tax=Nilaparvata lugens TaxID=108931 RepID=UPI00193E2C6C|nr:uncharacterized protein LOC120352987 [Nilaparvata lugens]